jgi:hypothetical protein
MGFADQLAAGGHGVPARVMHFQAQFPAHALRPCIWQAREEKRRDYKESYCFTHERDELRITPRLRSVMRT